MAFTNGAALMSLILSKLVRQPNFAKENLFNVLNNYIDFEGTTVLDLFAGTGSISIELVSRGCERVISVEKDPQHHAFICKVMNEVKQTNVFLFVEMYLNT